MGDNFDDSDEDESSLIYYFFSFCNFIFAGPHWKPHVCEVGSLLKGLYYYYYYYSDDNDEDGPEDDEGQEIRRALTEYLSQ